MTLQPLEKDRVRIRNLLEKEIKTGFKLVTDDFKGFDLKSFAEQIGTCISSANTLNDELDAILSKMSLIVQGPDETIMYEKQMDSDFAVIELACDLNSTLGLLQRLILGRITRCKEVTLSSNGFENICKAINRNSSLQVDEILTLHLNTVNDYQIKQREHVLGKNTKQKPSIDKASDTLHESRQNTCVVFDSLESTPQIQVQVKAPFNTIDQKRDTNQLKSKQKSYRKNKTKKKAAVLGSLLTVNNGSRCKGWNMQPRRGNKVKIKKGRRSMKGHAKSSKERMPQHMRHDCFAQQNERYMTRVIRTVRVKREPWIILMDGTNCMLSRKETSVYRGKTGKWKNIKPMKRRKKRRKKKINPLTKQMTIQH